MKILFIADVVGVPGRRALEQQLGQLRSELDVDLCIANGENAADGVGLTPRIAEKMLSYGVDAITLGNHTWRRPDLAPWIDSSERVVRPANLSRHAPGRGLTVVHARDGTPVAVINVMGQLFLDVACGPFELIDELVEAARAQTHVIFVDMHSEATSEKVALSRWLDGRVTAVVGTHTHVQTNDARVQRGGTAALTDAGMTGPHDSVIGVTADQAIARMRTGIPVRFETAAGDVRIEGALVECDAEGRATRCETVRIEVG
jgi:2',3'-cyclic-nucleotide 2'-phosphodiesterase